MNRTSKSLFAGSLIMLAGGLFVSFTSLPLAPEWTIVQPYGVILFGLFLLSLVFEKGFEKSSAREQSEASSRADELTPKTVEEKTGETDIGAHRHAYI